jgi:hypothetical protein
LAPKETRVRPRRHCRPYGRQCRQNVSAMLGTRWIRKMPTVSTICRAHPRHRRRVAEVSQFTSESPFPRTIGCMTRIAAVVVALCLTAFAAATQPMLPRCSPELDGQVTEGGCLCAYDRGGQLTGRAAGWRWNCDLLRGPGVAAPVPSAGDPPQQLPPGFMYAPQLGGRTGNTSGTQH